MLLNCDIGEDSWESLKPVNPKGNQYWIFTEGLMLKLKLQYFGYLIWRTDSLEKTTILGKIEGRRRRNDREWDEWMPSVTWWTWIWAISRCWWWTGKPCMLHAVCGIAESDTTELLNWTECGQLETATGEEFKILNYQTQILNYCLFTEAKSVICALTQN